METDAKLIYITDLTAKSVVFPRPWLLLKTVSPNAIFARGFVH